MEEDHATTRMESEDNLPTLETVPTTGVLNKASNLFRESLSVDYTAIFDADMQFGTAGPSSFGDRSDGEDVVNASADDHGPDPSTPGLDDDIADDTPRRPRLETVRPWLAKLVSFSNEGANMGFNVVRPKTRFTNKFLKKLLRRYPTGRI